MFFYSLSLLVALTQNIIEKTKHVAPICLWYCSIGRYVNIRASAYLCLCVRKKHYLRVFFSLFLYSPRSNTTMQSRKKTEKKKNNSRKYPKILIEMNATRWRRKKSPTIITSDYGWKLMYWWRVQSLYSYIVSIYPPLLAPIRSNQLLIDENILHLTTTRTHIITHTTVGNCVGLNAQIHHIVIYRLKTVYFWFSA